jgi:hypothetical protein
MNIALIIAALQKILETENIVIIGTSDEHFHCISNNRTFDEDIFAATEFIHACYAKLKSSEPKLH